MRDETMTTSDLGPPQLPECSLDFETLPPLVKGRCNACGAKLTGRQVKVCSPQCARWWQDELTKLGRKLAERQLLQEMAANRKNRPKMRVRVFSETGQLSREWLSRWRDNVEARYK